MEETSRVLFGAGFTELDAPSQDMILTRVQQGDPPGEIWTQLPSHVFFSKVLAVAVVKTYYAHPAAWNEIGYHGPSSPRGYSRIGDGVVDPWDVQVEGPEHDTR
ncbi:MAG: gluconate 2-dehydrogenase subunit 3 family protein [Nitrospirota bacterium]|nr:gluconate 2-dehydrogenase subunit 3 family protein [Nitrospirota bacterium]